MRFAYLFAISACTHQGLYISKPVSFVRSLAPTTFVEWPSVVYAGEEALGILAEALPIK